MWMYRDKAHRVALKEIDAISRSQVSEVFRRFHDRYRMNFIDYSKVCVWGLTFIDMLQIFTNKRLHFFTKGVTKCSGKAFLLNRPSKMPTA